MGTGRQTPDGARYRCATTQHPTYPLVATPAVPPHPNCPVVRSDVALLGLSGNRPECLFYEAGNEARRRACQLLRPARDIACGLQPNALPHAQRRRLAPCQLWRPSRDIACGLQPNALPHAQRRRLASCQAVVNHPPGRKSFSLAVQSAHPHWHLFGGYNLSIDVLCRPDRSTSIFRAQS